MFYARVRFLQPLRDSCPRAVPFLSASHQHLGDSFARFRVAGACWKFEHLARVEGIPEADGRSGLGGGRRIYLRRHGRQCRVRRRCRGSGRRRADRSWRYSDSRGRGGLGRRSRRRGWPVAWDIEQGEQHGDCEYRGGRQAKSPALRGLIPCDPRLSCDRRRRFYSESWRLMNGNEFGRRDRGWGGGGLRGLGCATGLGNNSHHGRDRPRRRFDDGRHFLGRVDGLSSRLRQPLEFGCTELQLNGVFVVDVPGEHRGSRFWLPDRRARCINRARYAWVQL